ncbi:MAG: hypothetical protein AB1778_04075 [Candidatus Bipolaricaulota bacterium]
MDERRWNDRVTLFGEIVAGEAGPEVRLDSDEVATLRPCPGFDAPVGYRGEFVLEGRAADGRSLVAPLRVGRGADADSVAAFDQEFDRLHQVLADRRGTSLRREADVPRLSSHEDGVRDWVARAGSAIARARKRRGKRAVDPAPGGHRPRDS